MKLDGDSSQQIFSIGGSQIEIIGLTLQNGYSDNWGGAISCGSYSDLTITIPLLRIAMLDRVVERLIQIEVN